MKNLNKVVWPYYVFVFFHSFSLFSAVLVPFYLEWGKITLFQVQILQSWFMFWIFVMEVPTGAIADYFGRKCSLMLGAVVVTVAVLIYGSVPKFEFFLLGEFIFAISIALISGADQAFLYDILKENGRENESKKVFGIAQSFRLFGMFIAAPIGSLVASKYGLNAPMLITAIPLFLSILFVWRLKEPRKYEKTSESKRYIEIVKKGVLYLKGHKTLKILALDAILVASASYFVIWLYQPLFMQLKVPIFYYGYFQAVLVGAEILISSNFVFLENLFGSGEKYLRYSALITGIFFVIVAIFTNFITTVMFIIFAGGFGLTRMELVSSYMNKFIPSEQRATILSTVSMFRRFALVILNPLVGYIANYSIKTALLFVGIIPIFVALFISVKNKDVL